LVIKAAQRLGFTLEEVADLIATGRHRCRPVPGLTVKAEAKLAEIEHRIHDVQCIAATLRAALNAGCADLTCCTGSTCWPIPFASLASDTDTQRPLHAQHDLRSVTQ
jgi:DNA-binding transcriptional MerR regulator